MEEHNEIHDLVRVSAVPKHEKKQTVQGANYVFSYHITIENNSKVAIQLRRRHWFISDGVFGEREVEGEGVIGQMPIIEPGSSFEYKSWCPVSSEYGSMSGFFTFDNLVNKEEFFVDVPSFVLLPEFALN